MKRTIILTVFICISVSLTCQEMTNWYQPYDQYKLYKKCKSDQGTNCLMTEESIDTITTSEKRPYGSLKSEKETFNYTFKKILYFDNENKLVKIRLILPIIETEKINFGDIMQSVAYRTISREYPVFTEINAKADKEITVDLMPVKYRINVIMGKAQNLTGCKPTDD